MASDLLLWTPKIFICEQTDSKSVRPKSQNVIPLETFL